MTENVALDLRQITVPFESLVLDPNNPRFITRVEDRIRDDDCVRDQTTGRTRQRLSTSTDKYKLEDLVRSIKQNAWLPVDYIFVRRLAGHSNFFLVLEGNRRLAAIHEIMNDEEPRFAALRESLSTLDVMEILSPGSDAELQKHITYLLGVRHHGSLIKWAPFAQAHNIFVQFLDEAGQTRDDFKWHEPAAKTVADTLSIDTNEVKERLKIYRVMAQVGSLPEVMNSEGGIKDRYYSVCGEPLISPRKHLGEYLSQHPDTFLLNQEGLGRLNNLCKFSAVGREGAAIHTPSEWRYLDKILGTSPLVTRAENLRKVEVDGLHPSDVWAEYIADQTPLDWEKWLFAANSILKLVTLDEDFHSPAAKSAGQQLALLLEELEARDKS